MKQKNEKSWRNIRQDVGRKPVTTEALKKKAFRFTKHMSCLVAVLSLVTIVLFGVSYLNENPMNLNLAGPSSPLKKVQYNTDGVLSHKWLTGKLQLEKGVHLMNVDILELKTRLEESPQVKSASVERIFPETLKVALKEYEPIFKVMAADRHGKRFLLLVSPEGHVYRGEDYVELELKELPYLITRSIKRDTNGYQPIKELDKVVELMQLAQSKYPDLYREWKVVSYKNLEEELLGVGAEIQVRSNYMKNIIFSIEEMDLQLNRLSLIQKEAIRGGIKSLAKVDLSYDESAIVELAQRVQ